MQVDFDFVFGISAAALGRWPTCWNTYGLCLVALRDAVPGDFVECGVFAGVHPGIMGRVVQRHDDTWPFQRRVHLFDSFVGHHEPGPEDGPDHRGPGPGRLIPTGHSACSLSTVRQNLDHWLGASFVADRMQFHKGWVQETLPKAAPLLSHVAVLRIDVDHYDAILCCLEHLYPKVPVGGWVILDDYALGGCVRAVHRYFGDRMPSIRKVVGGGGPAFFRKEAS